MALHSVELYFLHYTIKFLFNLFTSQIPAVLTGVCRLFLSIVTSQSISITAKLVLANTARIHTINMDLSRSSINVLVGIDMHYWVEFCVHAALLVGSFVCLFAQTQQHVSV